MALEKQFMPSEETTRLKTIPLPDLGGKAWLMSLPKRWLGTVLAYGLHYTGLLPACVEWGRFRSFEREPGTLVPKVRRSSHSKYGILCYHRVGLDGAPLHSQLDPYVFEKQMRYLREHYRIVPFDQLYQELLTASAVPPTIAVTFDDGYRDLYTHAFPVLRKYEIPAMIYLIGECMETGSAPWYDRIFAGFSAHPGNSLEIEMEKTVRFNLASRADRMRAAWTTVCYLRTIPDSERRRWCERFEAAVPTPQGDLTDRMLDWKQVREMQDQGISFGAHTMTHPSVGRLSEAEFDVELSRSKAVFETGLGRRADHFAFPFGKLGDRSRASEEFLRESGYLTAVTTTEGFNTLGANPFRLNRLQIGGERALATFASRIARLFCEQPPAVESPVGRGATAEEFAEQPQANRVVS
jgi:peptidoglycan/xylan/chitin deacetylase (PgdA/CDA1 family)